jgi:hypothetical protein
MEYRASQRAYSEATDAIKPLSAFNEVELAKSLTLGASEVFVAIIKDKL